MDQERIAVMDERSQPHRTGFGEWISPRLPLEPKPVKKLFHRRHLGIGNRDHQVHNPLSGTARHGGAADVLHVQVGKMLVNQGGDRSCDVGGAGIVVQADRRTVRVTADDRLHMLEHLADFRRQSFISRRGILVVQAQIGATADCAIVGRGL